MCDFLFDKFLTEILPSEKRGERFFYQAFYDDGTSHWDSRKKISSLSECIEREVERGADGVFYCAFRYKKPSEDEIKRLLDAWYKAGAKGHFREYHRLASCVTAAGGFFVDIDGLEDPVADMTDAELIGLIQGRYGLHPDWTVMSGHGLHLFFPTPDIDLTDSAQRAHFDAIQARIMDHVYGDPAAQLYTQILRAAIEGSFNRKHGDLIPVRLIHTPQPDHSIDRLDWLLDMYSDDDVEAYKREYRAAHPRKPRNKKTETDAPTSNKLKTKSKKPEHTDPDTTLDYMPRVPARSRYRAREADLHNYFVRRRGHLEGHRGTWAVMMATTWQVMGIKKADAKEKMKQYFPASSDFFDEAQRQIDYAYGPWAARHTTGGLSWSNQDVADRLGFTDYDIDRCSAWYTEEQRKTNCARARRKRQNQEARASRDAAIAEEIRACITPRGTLPCRDAERIAERYDVSMAKVRSIKASLDISDLTA